MDAARIAVIWTELKECGDETQLGFPLSTIKVGEACQLISDLAVLADAIERLTKQRDAALAENKKLNGVIGGLSAQSQDEIDRLTVTANNNAAAHAKACEDLAQARAEVERLKARCEKQSDMIRTIDPLYR